MVVRPRSDRGSRCTDKDRSEETEDRALIYAIKHRHSSLSTKTITIVLRSQTLVFRSRVWLLDDYNNKSS